MRKFNTFYLLLAVVLVIVILKTSCMGEDVYKRQGLAILWKEFDESGN